MCIDKTLVCRQNINTDFAPAQSRAPQKANSSINKTVWLLNLTRQKGGRQIMPQLATSSSNNDIHPHDYTFTSITTARITQLADRLFGVGRWQQHLAGHSCVDGRPNTFFRPLGGYPPAHPAAPFRAVATPHQRIAPAPDESTQLRRHYLHRHPDVDYLLYWAVFHQPSNDAFNNTFSWAIAGAG